MSTPTYKFFYFLETYLQGKFLEIGLWGHNVNMHAVLLNIDKFSSISLLPNCIPTWVSEWLFFHIFTNRVCYHMFIFCQSDTWEIIPSIILYSVFSLWARLNISLYLYSLHVNYLWMSFDHFSIMFSIFFHSYSEFFIFKYLNSSFVIYVDDIILQFFSSGLNFGMESFFSHAIIIFLSNLLIFYSIASWHEKTLDIITLAPLNRWESWISERLNCQSQATLYKCTYYIY